MARTVVGKPGTLKSAFAEVAALLARAYLRLTQKRPNDAVFQTRKPQKELDVSALESPHCDDA